MIGEYEEKRDQKNKISFLLDSAATDHLINRIELTDNFTVLETPIKLSIAKAGAYITATKRGNLKIVSNMGIEGILESVLYSPEVPNNLLSVARMQRAGYTLIIDGKGVEITKGETTIMKGESFGNLFKLIAQFLLET